MRNKLLKEIIVIGISSVLICAAPIAYRYTAMSGEEKKTENFCGTSEEIKKAVIKMNNGYKPWFTPFWNLAGDEIKYLLSSVQIAAGAILIGYSAGIITERRRSLKNKPFSGTAKPL